MMITLQKDVTHELRTKSVCYSTPGLYMAVLLWSKMKSVDKMVASKPECMKLGKWKNIMQEIPGKIRCASGNQCDPPPPTKTFSPLLITHSSSRPFSKMPVGGGRFARKHSIPMSTTNINQIIHVTWQYSILIVRIHQMFLKQGAKYEHISHRTI
jgi:hypothetical protein